MGGLWGAVHSASGLWGLWRAVLGGCKTPLLCMGSTWPNAARLESHPSLDYAAPAPLSGEPLVCAALEVRCKIGGRPLSQRVPRCQLPLKGEPRALGPLVPTETTQKPSTTVAARSPPHSVSYSEAASGLLTRLDDGCSCKSVWHSIQCAVAAPTPYAGGGFQRWGERPPPLVASFFPDSFFAIEERIGPPEGASPIAWKKLG